MKNNAITKDNQDAASKAVDAAIEKFYLSLMSEYGAIGSVRITAHARIHQKSISSVLSLVREALVRELRQRPRLQTNDEEGALAQDNDAVEKPWVIREAINACHRSIYELEGLRVWGDNKSLKDYIEYNKKSVLPRLQKRLEMVEAV